MTEPNSHRPLSRAYLIRGDWMPSCGVECFCLRRAECWRKALNEREDGEETP